VNVTYHVGSAREVQGMTGFAHFFEHMMFQGSKHVGDQQHFQLIQEAGGSSNGMTGQDLTHYFETVPANELFLVGNTDKSYDSRFWGTIDEKNVLGRAVTLW
jgi:predicted Zn-dependent peptidase